MKQINEQECLTCNKIKELKDMVKDNRRANGASNECKACKRFRYYSKSPKRLDAFIKREEALKLNHYTNLQWLLEKDHRTLHAEAQRKV